MSLPVQIPPHDLEAEGAVLSAVLLGDATALDVAASVLDPEHFYSEAHRRVFEAACALRDESKPFDVVQVGSWLRKRSRLEQVGGASYLTDLLNSAPALTPDSVAAYANTVRDHWALRRLILTCQQTAARGYLGVADTRAFLEEHQRNVFDLGTNRADVPYQRLASVVTKVHDTFKDRYANRGSVFGVPTGLRAMDRLLGGYQDGRLYCVAARPGMGKSSYVMNPVRACAEQGNAALMFCLEMPREEVGERFVCAEAHVSLQDAQSASFSPAAWSKVGDACARLATYAVAIDDSSAITIQEIRSKVRRFAAEVAREDRVDAFGNISGKRALRLVVVDYVQLMQGRGNANTRDEMVSEITRALKGIAKEFRLPVIALSQLNRKVEERADKRPMLSDLRESGAIEQDSDVVLFLFRDDYYTKKASQKPNVCEVIVAKNRGGPLGVADVGWHGWRTSFYDLPEDELPEAAQ